MSDSPEMKAEEDPFAAVLNVEENKEYAATTDLISLEPTKQESNDDSSGDNIIAPSSTAIDPFVEQEMVSPSKIKSKPRREDVDQMLLSEELSSNIIDENSTTELLMVGRAPLDPKAAEIDEERKALDNDGFERAGDSMGAIDESSITLGGVGGNAAA